MNNKGQSLILFVLLIPLLTGAFALIFDSSLIIKEYNKLKDLSKTSLTYMMEDNKSTTKIKEYISKNDKDIKIIDLTNNKIHLKKEVVGYFGKVIGYEKYELEVTFQGRYANDKLIIEKKG